MLLGRPTAAVPKSGVYRPGQPCQNTLHFLHAVHVHMLDEQSPYNIRRWRACPSATPFLLQLAETLQDDTFPTGETVAL